MDPTGPKAGAAASPPGTRRNPIMQPTMSNVARRAGVSTMSVSRFINGKEPLRKKTRDAVDAAISALKYVPNSAARSLAGKSSHRLRQTKCTGW